MFHLNLSLIWDMKMYTCPVQDMKVIFIVLNYIYKTDINLLPTLVLKHE